MTMQAPAEPLDRAFLAEIEGYLAAYGYKVTKARATRATSTESGRPDGAVPVTLRTSKRHGSCAEHWRVPGMREPVCVSRDTDETGAAIPAEWSDREQVLAFAVDVGARVPTGPAEYHGADQSGAFCGFTSALRADRAQIVA